MDWLYRLDELQSYVVDTKPGKQRLEKQSKNIPGLVAAAEIDLPRKSRVLCLMAGSCIEGIVFAEQYSADVTCVDLQQRLLAKGVKEAKRRGLKLRTVVADIRELSTRVKGKFDLVTILGGPLPHLNIFDFDKIVASILGLLSGRGRLLIEQSDVIFRILPQYRDAFVANLDPPVLNVHLGFNSREGCFERLYLGRTKHETFKVYLYSPWIIEYVLRKNGFDKVNVVSYAAQDVQAQTYLITGRVGRV